MNSAKQLSLLPELRKESLSGLAGQGVGSTKPVLLSDCGIFAKSGDLLTPRISFLLTLCAFPADTLGNRSFYRATTLPDAVGGVGSPKRLYVPVTRKVSLTDETKAGVA